MVISIVRAPCYRLPKMSRRARKRIGFRETFLGIILLIAGAAFWIYSSIPDVRILKTEYPVVQYRGPDVPPLVSFQKTRPRSWASLGEISKQAVGAIIVSEDWAYYQHHGYDMNQIRKRPGKTGKKEGSPGVRVRSLSK